MLSWSFLGRFAMSRRQANTVSNRMATMAGRYLPEVAAALLVFGPVSSCAASTDQPPEPQEMRSQDTRGSATALARRRLAPLLPVSPRTLDLAAGYLALVSATAESNTEANLCSIIEGANEVTPRLGSELSQIFIGLIDSSRANPDSAGDIEEFRRHVESASQLLPGIGLAVGAETIYHYVRYREIARLAKPGSIDERFLSAVGEVWSDPTGWPSYIDQQTDVAGCWRPGNLVDPVRRLISIRLHTSTCVERAVRPVIGRAMLQAVDASCFCENEPKVRYDLAQLAAEYEKAGIPAATRAAETARNTLKSASLRFDCR